MKAEVLRPTELDEADKQRWRSFQSDTASLGSPFLSPEFACAADRARRDVRVAVLRDGSDTVGYLPYTLGPLGIAAPVAPGFCDQQAVIHAPHAPIGLRAALEATPIGGLRFDHLLRAHAPEPTGDASVTEACSWLIELPEGWDAYERWANANRKRYINWMARKDRRFDVDHPDANFDYDSRDGRDLSELLRLKSAQCRARGWDDLFAPGWRRQMVEDLATANSPSCRGTVSALRIGTRVVAADFSLRGNGIYAGWQIAYDADMQQSSPGIVRWRRVIEAAAAGGPVTIDLGKGVDDFKSRFSTSTLPLAEGMIASGRSGRAVLSGQRVLLRGRQHFPGVETWMRSSVQRWRRRRYGTSGPPVGAG